MLTQKPYAEVKPEEMLMLSPRKVIKNQQLKNKNTVIVSDEGNLLEDNTNKIRVSTAQGFGRMIANGDIRNYRVVILDEIPTLFLEVFAEDLRIVLDWLKEQKNTIVIGLTATPELLLKYVDEFQFENVCLPLPPKYQSDKMTVFINGQTVETYVRDELMPKVDGNNKALVYIQSAKDCYKMAQTYKNSGFFISDYNESYIEEDKAGVKVYIADVMKESGIKDFIIEEEKLPDDIDILFMNASAREGMNLKDENIKYIVVVASDTLTIQQVIGRQRGDLKEITIFAGYRYQTMIRNELEKYKKFIEELPEDEVLQIQYLTEYRNQKQKMKNEPKFVYKTKDGFYKINPCLKPRLQYLRDAVLQSENYTCGSQEMKHTIDGKVLLNAQNYFGQLQKYSRSQIRIEYQQTEAVKIKRAKKNGIERFKEIEDEVLGIRLYQEDKEKLVGYLNFKRSQGRNASWASTKSILIEAGYSVKDGRGKNRYSVISK